MYANHNPGEAEIAGRISIPHRNIVLCKRRAPGGLLSGRKWRVLGSEVPGVHPPWSLPSWAPARPLLRDEGPRGWGRWDLAVQGPGPREGLQVGGPLTPWPLPSDRLFLLPRFFLLLRSLYNPTLLFASL